MQLKTALRCFRIFILHISHHLRFYSDFAIISLCRWRTRGRGRYSERDSVRCLLFLLMHCISLLLPLLCSVGLVCCWCKSLFIFLILPFASRNTKSGRSIRVFLCVLLVALARSLLVVEVEAAREQAHVGYLVKWMLYVKRWKMAVYMWIVMYCVLCTTNKCLSLWPHWPMARLMLTRELIRYLQHHCTVYRLQTTEYTLFDIQAEKCFFLFCFWFQNSNFGAI